MKLKDKVALITGASRGIGKAIACAYAGEGADVIINYKNSKKQAQALADELCKKGSDSTAIRSDVSKIKDIESLVKTVVDRYGRIDILVNNAGRYLRNTFFESSEDIWNEILDTNLKSVFFCSKLVSEQMIKQGSGRIINIASVSGIRQKVSKGIEYGIAKCGVIYATKSTALLLAQYNITVNAIAPGYTLTGLTGYTLEQKAERELQVPLHRLNDPEDIARAALFLASDDARYITGQVLAVDGGMSVK